MERDEIVSNIGRLQVIVDKLSTDELWKMLLLDIRSRISAIDVLWADTYDKKQLEQLRVEKKAMSLLMMLPDMYSDNLAQLKKELNSIDNGEIQGDYDTEGIK